jgi:hypothetical protein
LSEAAWRRLDGRCQPLGSVALKGKGAIEVFRCRKSDSGWIRIGTLVQQETVNRRLGKIGGREAHDLPAVVECPRPR